MDIERIYEEITKLTNAISCLGQPNWLDYLQVIASIVSIIISALAVIMAVSVPKQISNNCLARK